MECLDQNTEGSSLKSFGNSKKNPRSILSGCYPFELHTFLWPKIPNCTENSFLESLKKNAAILLEFIILKKKKEKEKNACIIEQARGISGQRWRKRSQKGGDAESGSGECRTSNKIILTTRLNYARGTNNNIWPARIPAINIEAKREGGTAPFALHGRFPSTAHGTLVFRVYLEGSPQLCGAKLWGPVVSRGNLRKTGVWPPPGTLNFLLEARQKRGNRVRSVSLQEIASARWNLSVLFASSFIASNVSPCLRVSRYLRMNEINLKIHGAIISKIFGSPKSLWSL